MIRGRHGRVLVLWVTMALFAVLPGSAAADDVSKRRVGVRVLGDALQVSFGCRDVFNKAVRKKLPNALTNRVVIQIGLEREGRKELVSVWIRTVELTYELWDEKYIINSEDNTAKRQTIVDSMEKAIDLAGILKNVTVANVKGAPPGTYRFWVRVEVNPVSEEMVTKIQEWLNRSRARKGSAPGHSNPFLGLVQGMINRNIGKADHRVEFVSQWFRLGGR
jgi:hypothetical protein